MRKRFETQIFMGNGDKSIADIGELFLQLNEALIMLGGIQQPLMSTEAPMTPDEAWDMDIKEKQVDLIARNIYTALTGKQLLGDWE